VKSIRYYVIGFSWLPVIALAAWWAGFMPFPTRPAEIGAETNSIDGMTTGSNFRHLISAATAKEKGKHARYGMGSWYCEEDNKQFCHIYEIREEPFYGLISPSWVLKTNTTTYGETAMALYSTYAACKWSEERNQKASDDSRVTYERWATEQHQKVESREYELWSCERIPT